VPIIAALLLVPGGRTAPWMTVAGALLVAGGEVLRLWGVRHIGVISRTRSDRLGPLVTSGPFGLTRNPLYLGNVALWAGFALLARVVWLAPIIVAALAVEYHAIVRWEERLLVARRGDEYLDYLRRVPRWLPRPRADTATPGELYSWRDTIFSERGTLIAIAAGLVLLRLKG
jgi:protein-S-isoprenylcysteine O-methyltransferase Ste14